MPAEDGFYQFEKENVAFRRTYYEIWEVLEELGKVESMESPYGPMIENSKLLELTRAKEKLQNPNLGI
jgi:hypothetical protein